MEVKERRMGREAGYNNEFMLPGPSCNERSFGVQINGGIVYGDIE